VQQLSDILTEIGHYYRPVYGNLDDLRVVEEIVSLSRVSAAKRKIANSRIGVVGYPHIKGQTQAAFDEIKLHRKLGARVVSISMHHFVTTVSSIEDREVNPIWKKVSEGMGAVSVNEEQINEGVWD